MLKIVEIISGLSGRGGAETMFYNLCKTITSSEVELHIVSLFDEIHDSFEDIKRPKNAKFYSLHKRKGFDLKCSKVFKKTIKQINPDIIHFHVSGIVTYFLAFGLKRRKWDVYYTVHNIADLEGTKLSRMVLKKYVKANNVKLIGISDSISKSICEFYKTSKVETVYNGVPLIEQTRNIEFSNRQYDFVCVARFSIQKNHKLLFDAFNDFWKTHQTSSLLCVGGGELFDEMNKYANCLECHNKITFVGSQSDVYQYLNNSKVFTLSSIFEGNPISILEAMNAGLPIIAPKVGGIPDVVSEENGVTFEVGQKEQLVEAMKIVLDNKLLEIYSICNMKKAQEYSIINCANNYLNLFKKMGN